MPEGGNICPANRSCGSARADIGGRRHAASNRRARSGGVGEPERGGHEEGPDAGSQEPRVTSAHRWSTFPPPGGGRCDVNIAQEHRDTDGPDRRRARSRGAGEPEAPLPHGAGKRAAGLDPDRPMARTRARSKRDSVHRHSARRLLAANRGLVQGFRAMSQTGRSRARLVQLAGATQRHAKATLGTPHAREGTRRSAHKASGGRPPCVRRKSARARRPGMPRGRARRSPRWRHPAR